MTNQLIYDNAGIPSIMVPVQKFLLSDVIDGAPDVPHPAFIVNGREIDTIYVSKYQNIVVNDRAYSMALQRPQTEITFDQAAEACEAKGPGWHLMTRAEWAAIALWCKRNGTLPRGNNDGGCDHQHPDEKGIKYGGGRVLTGSGPATWAHDHTPEGIFDLNGNVLEWVSGLRWMEGEVQVIPDNNAAAGANQRPDSPEWAPILADGKPVCYQVTDEGIALTTKKPGKRWGGSFFRELKAEIDVPLAIKALALFPDGEHVTDEYFWIDSNGERLACCGGPWYLGGGAGVFYCNGYTPRSGVLAPIGFRSAFVPPEI